MTLRCRCGHEMEVDALTLAHPPYCPQCDRPLAPRALPRARREARLATLERQLQRYLARVRPPAKTPALATRRETLRRRVVRENLREQRALLTRGHAIGWRKVALTEEDEARVGEILGDG